VDSQPSFEQRIVVVKVANIDFCFTNEFKILFLQLFLSYVFMKKEIKKGLM